MRRFGTALVRVAAMVIAGCVGFLFAIVLAVLALVWLLVLAVCGLAAGLLLLMAFAKGAAWLMNHRHADLVSALGFLGEAAIPFAVLMAMGALRHAGGGSRRTAPPARISAGVSLGRIGGIRLAKDVSFNPNFA